MELILNGIIIFIGNYLLWESSLDNSDYIFKLDKTGQWNSHYKLFVGGLEYELIISELHLYFLGI